MSVRSLWLAEVIHRTGINEGRKPWRYLDSLGIPTIGEGWNLQRSDTRAALARCGVACINDVIAGRAELTDSQIDALFAISFAPIEEQARASLAPGVFDALSDARRAVVCDLEFNLGQRGWVGFAATRALINEAQAAKNAGAIDHAHVLFGLAADHLRASAWDGQVHARARRDEAMMRSGVWVDASGDGSTPEKLVVAALRKANTHAVSGAGVVLTAAGMIADPSVSHSLASVLPAHYAAAAAHALVVVGAVGLYLGRPKTVASAPAVAVEPPSTVAAIAAAPPSVAPIAETVHVLERTNLMAQPDFIKKAEVAALDRVIGLAEDPANEAAVLDFVSKELAAGEVVVTPLADSLVDSLAKKNMFARMFAGEAKAQIASMEAALVAEAGSAEKFAYAKGLAELHAMRDALGK